MTVQSSIAFVLAMSLFVASPGPGALGLVAETMKYGLKSAGFYIFGMILGDMVYLTFAVFGLAAVASVMGEAFMYIRIAGGIYLLYLGIKLILAKESKPEKTVPSKKGRFLGGFFITITNPKVIIFYCGFLPNFMDLTRLTLTDAMVTAVLVAFVISAVMGSYAVVAHRTGKFLTGRGGLNLNRAAGAALIGTGSFLIFKRP
ncbi:LysE family translocator [Seleniivibrio woodruffii]|uniref:Threonine/homoserine/homoserine lactone efflux protein n=1 Tax=Seleniivibrio woodruffii TaxID=1078050 RepID=A0A4R1KD66_9BACT|nr:LysE family translocator [Seleniivibrio woodruffii]TCK62526.1 threonine/homoserine/homoserine lactone efflux protein [Seleniivibrio woodruffii]TVZ37047.1 threonine/homoserine/homoserine lactone efflux protein [Seleniivibrio woodruffii]